MPIVLYHLPVSAPCRAVRLTAAAIGIHLDLKVVNLKDGDHLKPEFIKMNPQHMIPTIDDNGFYLWESRAITAYLVEQYAKDDSLYPKDPKKRAIVNQRLYFDQNTLYKAMYDYVVPLIRTGHKDEANFEKMNAALELLDKFLEGHAYVAGNTMTIADLSMFTTIEHLEAMEYDRNKLKNIWKWFDRMKKEAPKCMEIHEEGIKAIRDTIEELRKKKQENDQ